MGKVVITKEEQKAIRSLERLAKRWPKGIELFGWSGSLYVTKTMENGILGAVTSITIPCDGGDPTEDELDQFCEVEYE